MLKTLIGAATAGLLLAACSSAPPSASIEKSLDRTTPARQTVASTALAQVGDAYTPNMAGPDQYDDSGLAYYAYRQNGRALPRDARDQLNAGQPIALNESEPGDLVFFRLDAPDGRGRLSVGILVSADTAIISLPGTTASGGGVRKVSISGNYWRGRFVGVTRILPDAATPSS